MEQFRADLASWLVSLGAGKLSHEFFNLVNAIGSAKSKQEEAFIIKKEAELLQHTINKPENQKTMREFLIRGLYCEMLGHPVPFVYIHALNMTQSPRLLDKRVGYLCTSIFLNDSHELLLLLLNSVRKDLDSTNILEVSAALSCMSWLLNKDTVNAILPLIIEKSSSSNELVRKKAVILLLRCLQKDVFSTWSEVENVLRSRLCDSDPSVMAVSLHCFLYVLKLKSSDPITYVSLPNLVDLVPSFVGILKQLVEKRLPPHYDYHKSHGPWIQISILRLLRYSGSIDPNCVTHMSQVLKLILTTPADRMAACAVVNEAILTICSFASPDRPLLDLAARNISLFLGATSADLNYLGLKLLAKIVTINPLYANEHQAHVISCLESPDETIRSKTIELLFHMTNTKNLVVIVGKMLERLKKTTDAYLRTELVKKITTLAEKYSTDNFWFITTMNDVFLTAGDQVSYDVAYKFLRYIAEGATDNEDVNIDLRLHAVNAYMQLSGNPQLSDILQTVMAWVIGEYGYLIANPMEAVNALADLLDRAPSIKASSHHQSTSFLPFNANTESAYRNIDSFSLYYGNDVKQWIISGLTKLAASGGVFPLHVREAFEKLAGSDNTEVSRRCQEALALMNRATGLASSGNLIDPSLGKPAAASNLLSEVFPTDAAAEDLLPSELLASSLDAYVKNALAAGARPYSRPVERSFLQTTTPKEEKALRWKAYERPTEVPRFNPAHAASPLGTGASGLGLGNGASVPYNPLMTTVSAGGAPISPMGGSTASAPAPATPTSLASLATRSGPWSSGGFGRNTAAAPANAPQTSPQSQGPTTGSYNASTMSNNSSSGLGTNRNTSTSQGTMDTYKPRMDANQTRLANALFSGVGEAPSGPSNHSPTSTNILQTANPNAIAARKRQIQQGTGSRDSGNFGTRSDSSSSLSTGNLIDMGMSEPTQSPTSTNSASLLSLGIDGLPQSSHLPIHSNSSSSSSLMSSQPHNHTRPNHDVLSGASPSHPTSPSSHQGEIDLLGGSISSMPISSGSDRGTPTQTSFSPSSSQGSVHEVMQFTDPSSGGASANGGQLKQLNIDADNWNLTNLSKSSLVSTYLEPFPKPSPASLPLSKDPFLCISVLKSWSREGMNVGVLFGNRTSLRLSKVMTQFKIEAPVKIVVEVDATTSVNTVSSTEYELGTNEISSHFSAVAVLRLIVLDKVSLSMSISGTTTFEVHNQLKTIKYRIPIDFRDFVRSLPVAIDQFGSAWNSPNMREVSIRAPSATYNTTSELATTVSAQNFAIIQAGKAEIVAACALCFDTNAPNAAPSAACLLHVKLDTAAKAIDFTFKSESHSFAEIASRYFSSLFG